MKKKKLKFKNRFLVSSLAIIVFLLLVSLLLPSGGKEHSDISKTISDSASVSLDTVLVNNKSSCFFNADGSVAKHAIISVPDYETSFPDLNDVQLLAAKQHGVTPVENRAEAEHRNRELVFIGYNPYYQVKKLYNSIPYLVPRAALLLQDIGRNFMDSLQLKNIPINKIFVTSVLRTKEDVIKLRSFNRNASENSCHQYATTFDIAYNKYYAITRPVRDDTLKWVLAEVLHDLRSQNRCYVKHERHQGCFHITVR